jgi:superfamily I DNA/RNA helicase
VERNPLHGGAPPGREVEVLGYRDEDDLARLLIRVLQNLEAEGVPLEDIVVLTPTRSTKSALRNRGRVNGYEFSNDPQPGKVFVSTVHGLNGLERPVVILAELDEQRGDLTKYLYVGGSRARNHLIVLATEPVAKRLRVLAGVAKG